MALSGFPLSRERREGLEEQESEVRIQHRRPVERGLNTDETKGCVAKPIAIKKAFLEWQQSRSSLHWIILPLIQHDSGTLLNIDEAYALSYKRILQ